LVSCSQPGDLFDQRSLNLSTVVVVQADLGNGAESVTSPPERYHLPALT
jgi:hypothetical protein